MPYEKRKIQPFRVGVHTSIAGGISKSVERAVALNCATMQIFSHNPRQWRKSPITDEESLRFALLRRKYDIAPVFIHASYLINLASPSDAIMKKSLELLSYELRNADILGAEYVVLHTGSASGDNEKKARRHAIKAISTAFHADSYNTCLLLENTAGERGDITSSIQSLADIIDGCNSDCTAGLCIDTCHAFASGHDLTTPDGIGRLLYEIEKYIGLDKLKLIHLNDSRRPLGSGVDRHEHIGKGFIGTRGFENILADKRISKVPIILETPKKNEGDDKRNLRKVLRILSRLCLEL